MVSPTQRALAEQVGLEQQQSSLLRNGGYTGRRPEADGSGGGTGVVGLTVEDEGTPVGATNSVKTLDFVGASVSASQTGDRVTVTLSGSGGGGGNSYMPGGW
jgi:hypothetical protein